MSCDRNNVASELRFAKSLFGRLPGQSLSALKHLITKYQFSVAAGDVIHLGNGWYVTHSGLLRLAERRRCIGMNTRPVIQSSDPANCRWVFKATVFKTRACKGFTGYGD